MALYIKYRPKTFDELVKQDHIVNILKPKLIGNEYKHSNFLFYGPRGTGKTSTARIFAKAINCTNLQNGNPCNACESCIIINTGKTIDVVEIDAASHTQVDNIREEIIDKAPYPPAQLKKKVYIIDEVHMLSKSAFNALLKIMEEPPHYLVFILATTEIHKVPETIISRCQIFTFKKIPVNDLVIHLAMICKKENLTYADEALISIAKIADGCARDAVKYLDQISILGDITQAHVTSFLGVASDQLLQDFLQAIIKKDSTTAFSVIDTIHDTGVDIQNFIKQCLVYIEEHFNENISGYIICADILKRIAFGMRNFPHPTILMKMEIYNTLLPINQDIPTTIGTSANASILTKIVPKDHISDKIPENISSTTSSDELLNDVKKTTIPEISSQQNNSLLQQIANNEQVKSAAKSILEKSCILEQGEESSTLFILNKLQGSILQKPEHRSVVEKVFKELTGSNHGLQIVVTTKEEYLASKL